MNDGIQVLEGDGIPPADMLARLAEAEKVIDNREFLLTKEKELNERDRTIEDKNNRLNQKLKDIDEKSEEAINGCKAIASLFDFICLSKGEYDRAMEEVRSEEREVAREELQDGELVAEAMNRECDQVIYRWVEDFVGNANVDTIQAAIRFLLMSNDNSPALTAEALSQLDSLNFDQWAKAMVNRLTPMKRQALKDILQ